MLLDRQSLRDEASGISAETFDGRLWRVDLTTREPRRYMAGVSAPYLALSGRSADWGFYCAKCIDNKEPATHSGISI